MTARDQENVRVSIPEGRCEGDSQGDRKKKKKKDETCLEQV